MGQFQYLRSVSESVKRADGGQAMYCEKCGRLEHGDRPCGAIATIEDGSHRPAIVTQPTMVVIAPPNRRLESGGWFARSFMTTAGVIAALLALPACCVAMLVIALVTERIANPSQLTKDAKRIAMQSLERHGVDTLSSDSMASRYD